MERSIDNTAMITFGHLESWVVEPHSWTHSDDLESSPREHPKRHLKPLQEWRLRRALQFVDEHLEERITLASMANAAGLTRMYFAAQFRLATGVRPHEYVLRRRIEKACELLCRTRLAIVEVALIVGFQTQAHFTTVFKRLAGVPPLRWRRTHGMMPRADQSA